MSTKSILKCVAAFAILAIVLIFLGVNYVPRIYAQSSNKAKIVDNVIQLRPDYVNENYQRAIVPQRIYTGADFLNHHPYDVTQKLNFAASDFLNHHPYDTSK